jgi:hypothetical protein
MNDGRILYTRWEYVDKGVIAVQDLWAMRPDGTGAAEVYGNAVESPPVLIHGRAIPGDAGGVVCTATLHHPFAVGPILGAGTVVESYLEQTGLAIGFFLLAAGSASSSKRNAREGFIAICTQSRSCRSIAFAITVPSAWLVIPTKRATFCSRSW